MAIYVEIVLVEPALHAQVGRGEHAVLVRSLYFRSYDLPRPYLAIVTTGRQPLKYQRIGRPPPGLPQVAERRPEFPLNIFQHQASFAFALAFEELGVRV